MKLLNTIDPRLNHPGIWFGLGCLWIMIVCYLSLTSTPPALPATDHSDKVAHALAYALLTLWWLQLYSRWVQRWIIIAGSVLLGTGIEVAQSFHPLRYFDVWDMLANCVGVTLAILACLTPLSRLLIGTEATLGLGQQA